jgi:hypothetical protein
MDNLRRESSFEPAKAALALTPEVFFRNWQQTGARVVRAQERMMLSVANAIRMEMQFGQEMIKDHITPLPWTRETGQTTAGRAMQDFERIVAVTRDVSEELRSGFTEAAKLLTEGMGAPPQETEPADKTVRAAAETNGGALNAVAEAMEKAVVEDAAGLRKTKAL